MKYYFVRSVCSTLPKNQKNDLLKEWAKEYENCLLSEDEVEELKRDFVAKVEELNNSAFRSKALEFWCRDYGGRFWLVGGYDGMECSISLVGVKKIEKI